MSDCFDHEGDAWASLDWEDGWGSPWRSYHRGFNRDPLYYHTLITFKEVKAQTDKSYLVVTHGKEVWLPKKICRGFSADAKTTYVHTQTFAKILDAARNS